MTLQLWFTLASIVFCWSVVNWSFQGRRVPMRPAAWAGVFLAYLVVWPVFWFAEATISWKLITGRLPRREA